MRPSRASRCSSGLAESPRSDGRVRGVDSEDAELATIDRMELSLSTRNIIARAKMEGVALRERDAPASPNNGLADHRIRAWQIPNFATSVARNRGFSNSR